MYVFNQSMLMLQVVATYLSDMFFKLRRSIGARSPRGAIWI